MVEWASGGYVRTFDQSAANGKKEPILPIFCNAAKVHFRKTGGIALKITAETGP